MTDQRPDPFDWHVQNDRALAAERATTQIAFDGLKAAEALAAKLYRDEQEKVAQRDETIRQQAEQIARLSAEVEEQRSFKILMTKDATRLEAARDEAVSEAAILRAERDAAQQQIATLKGAIGRTPAVSTWQLIETAPKDGTPVLLFTPESIQHDSAPKPFFHVSRWVHETREHWEPKSEWEMVRVIEDASHWESWELPTLWLPLPAPPGQESPEP